MASSRSAASGSKGGRSVVDVWEGNPHGYHQQEDTEQQRNCRRPELSRPMFNHEIPRFLNGESRDLLVAAANEQFLIYLSSREGRKETHGRFIWFNLEGKKLELGEHNEIMDDGKLEKVADQEAFCVLPVNRRFFAVRSAIAAAANGYPVILDRFYIHDMKKGVVAFAPEGWRAIVPYYRQATLTVVSQEEYVELLRGTEANRRKVIPALMDSSTGEVFLPLKK